MSTPEYIHIQSLCFRCRKPYTVENKLGNQKFEERKQEFIKANPGLYFDKTYPLPFGYCASCFFYCHTATEFEKNYFQNIINVDDCKIVSDIHCSDCKKPYQLAVRRLGIKNLNCLFGFINDSKNNIANGPYFGACPICVRIRIKKLYSMLRDDIRVWSEIFTKFNYENDHFRFELKQFKFVLTKYATYIAPLLDFCEQLGAEYQKLVPKSKLHYIHTGFGTVVFEDEIDLNKIDWSLSLKQDPLPFLTTNIIMKWKSHRSFLIRKNNWNK